MFGVRCSLLIVRCSVFVCVCSVFGVGHDAEGSEAEQVFGVRGHDAEGSEAEQVFGVQCSVFGVGVGAELLVK
jgi:hypothetical protein